eukprot:1549149-Amphidinium_carterae.1
MEINTHDRPDMFAALPQLALPGLLLHTTATEGKGYLIASFQEHSTPLWRLSLPLRKALYGSREASGYY